MIEPELLARALDALAADAVIGFPTETYYGLGARLTPAGLQAVERAKGRPGAPISLLLPDAAALSVVASERSPLAQRLIARFWPGPLTLVVPARPEVPAPARAADGTVAVRVSSHPVAAALVSAFQAPITATSANLHGRPPAASAGELDPALALAVIVDGGRTPGGAPSTFVRVLGERWTLVRAGAVPVEEVIACAGPPSS